jgi:protein phosphatase 1L
MAPSFRRAYSGGRTAPVDSPDDRSGSTVQSSMTSADRNKKSSMWERRRKRKDNVNKPKAKTAELQSKNAPKKFEDPDDEDFDPYDSDPGESYREHCMKMNGTSNKSCLTAPRFLRKTRKVEEDTVMTAPPSPMASEMGDLFGQIPASLPSNLTRVKYSLRSSITDGSEKQPSGPSVMERRELRPNNVHINVSHWSDTGGRPYMEDRYVLSRTLLIPQDYGLLTLFLFSCECRYVVENLDAVQVEVSPVGVKTNDEDVEVTYGPRRTRRLTLPLTFCGVFDGHGGDKASQFCSDWMSAYVRNDDSYPYDLGYSMKNAFVTIDDDFVNTGQTDGSTACAVSIVGGRRVVCANAGDSRAIVVRRDGSIVRLSRDHKPGIPDETRRISELGGRVIYWGRWRVEGLLAVSRSVGDASLKPYITAEPEICEYDIGKDDWFLVLSSDGVWDVMDNEEAAHVVIASSCAMEDGRLKIDTDRFKWAARNLCEHARSCGSSDNFSVLVVDLKSCGNPLATSGRYEP